MSEGFWKVMEKHKFEINNEISNDLKCKICNELMIKSCNAPCGCRFCSDCIEHYLNGNDKFCPGTTKYCQKKTINYANDIAIDRPINVRISEMVVKCPSKNCPFESELGMIENHMRTCNKRLISCPFVAIGCERNEIMSDEMKDHLNEDIFHHSNLLIYIVNNLHDEMESMKNENIELKIENREFKQKLDNIELRSANHQQKMCELEIKESENAIQIEDLNEEIMAVNNDNGSLKKEMEAVTENFNIMRQQTEMIQTKSQKQIDELKQNYEQWQRKEKKESEMLERKLDKICEETSWGASKLDNYNERFKQIIDGEINNSPMSMIEMGTKLMNGEIFWHFQWKIENLSKQKKETRIHSEPFYSEQCGYQMCLSGDICDDGIIVNFHLMRGEFDDKLEWPFKYTVTIDAIELGNGNIFQSKTRKYSDCPDADGWRKPTYARNHEIWFYMIEMFTNSPAAKREQVLLKCRIESEK